jgi:hypothetical protein
MATINAASCSLADVTTAVAAASAGDTVSIPAGSATWDSNLVITKGLYIIGAGQGLTNITSNFTGTGGTGGTANWLINYNPANPSLNAYFRLSGMSINCASRCGALGLWNTSVTYPQSRIRIDHITTTNALHSCIVQGPIRGVMDNCSLTQASGVYFNFLFYSLDTIWTYHTFTLGTGDNFYVEDCTLNCSLTDGGCTNAGFGQRYAIRDCTINQAGHAFSLWDAHGNMGPGNGWSTQGIEMYRNTINAGNYMSIVLDHRGGRAAIWDNTFLNNGQSAGMQIREEYYDSGNPPATALDGQPQYPSGSYYWLNTKNGAMMNPGVEGTLDYPGLSGVPTINREFWVETTPFTGAAGVGTGLLSARPSSGLSVGVGYWATDTQTLYRATSATTWETFYTPYEYPHPIRAGQENPPAGFTHTQTTHLTVSNNEVGRLYVEIPKKRAVIGTSVIYNVHAEPWNDFTGNVTLDVAGMPTNAADTYGTNPIAYNGTTTVTVATTGVAAGTYSMNITGTSAGGDVASVRVILEVVAAADADIKVPIKKIRAKQGDNAVYTIQADALSGYTSDVDLSVSGVPAGASSSFADSSIAYNGSTTLTVDTGTAAVGEYELIITGEGPA